MTKNRFKIVFFLWSCAMAPFAIAEDDDATTDPTASPAPRSTTAAKPAAATTGQGTSSNPTALQGMEVQAHYDNAVGTSDAASEGAILGTLLQDIPLLRPGEVLESIPGMVVTQHSGDGKANQYFLRGYNLDHGTDLASFVDGVPVNMPTNAHGQGYTDLNFLIPELVQDVDYRKGPYYADTGDFSSAGSDDVHYRNTLDSDLLDITAGSYDYRRMLLAGSRPISGTQDDGINLLGALETTHVNGPWEIPEGSDRLNGLLRLSGGSSANGWSVDAIAYAAHWRSTDQVPLAAIQSGQLCLYCAMDPTDGGRTARDILSGEWHANDADGYLKISGWYEHYRLNLWSNFTFYEYYPETGDQFEQLESRNILGAKIAKGWNHGLFGHDSTTEVGVQLRHDDIHVGRNDTENRSVWQVVQDDLVSETEGALYVQNTTQWTDWLRSLAGLREDAIRMNLDAQNFPVNSGNASDSRVSPKLSLIFGPWDKTEFFVDVGNGFHSDDARGVIYRYEPLTDIPQARAPALVGSFGKEIGLRTEIIPGLQSSLALWSLNSESELEFDADDGTTDIDGASKRYGIEWSNHYVLSNWLLFDADMAWTHARYAQMNANDTPGNFIPNSVGRVMSVGLSAHQGPWTGDIKWRYIGGYPLSQDDILRAPPAITTSLRVQRQLNDFATLSLDVLNLFDRHYFDIAYEQDYRLTPTAPIDPDGITVHPGEPREFRLTLRLKL